MKNPVLLPTGKGHPPAVDRELWDVAPCPCVKAHSPRPAMVELHHVYPAAEQRRRFAGQVRYPERLPLCSTGHELVHLVIDARRAGRQPPRVNRYLRALAERGLAAIATGELPQRTLCGTIRR